MNSLFNSVLETASLFKNCDGYSQSTILKEECAELIVLYGENTQDLTEDDIIDINKMLASLAKTPSILQEGDPTNGNA